MGWQQLRYAARQLRRSPSFTLVAILTLAIGIGANTAIFTLVNASLLRPLPYRDADRLVHVSEIRTAGGWQPMQFSYPNYLDFRDRNQSFAALGAYGETGATYNDGKSAEQVDVTVASANFFDTLGVRPALGRFFTADADRAGGEKAVVLSHRAWMQRFGSDPNAVGRGIRMDGSLCTIVGVLPASFQFAPDHAVDFWMPLAVEGWRLRRNAYWLSAVGRLKDGTTLQQARAEAATISQQLEKQYPDANQDVAAELLPLPEKLFGNVRPVLLVLMAAVAAVLLITCSNLAALQLARSIARQREVAVRSALGASRSRILSLLLTENLLLAIAGGLAGFGLAYLSLPLLVASIPKEQLAYMPFLTDLHIDGAVLLFCAAVSVGSGLLFGMIPALQAARSSVSQSLQEGARSTASFAHHAVRNVLVVSQIALAVLLLFCAGLLLKSLVRLLNVDPGFKTAHLLTFETLLPGQRYNTEAQVAAAEQSIRERLQQLPGVISVATVNSLPLKQEGGTSRFVVAGHGRNPAEEQEANTRDVSTNYFTAMGIPLRAGRFLDEHDTASSRHVVVVNQVLADRLFHGQDPIGKKIDFTYTNDPNLWEIVGIVGNENVNRLDSAPNPAIYDSLAQSPSGQLGVVIRTAQDPAAIAASAREAMHELDPDLPVASLASMDDVIAQSPATMMRRYPAYLIGFFASLALVLAALGIYGLLAYVVAQRTRELGIRLALGAQREDVLRLILRNGFKLATVGVLLGAAGSLAAGHLLATLLFQVQPRDMTTFAAVASLLVAVALLASYLPARRAASIEPMQALRTE